jgi:hypothetical protein
VALLPVVQIVQDSDKARQGVSSWAGLGSACRGQAGTHMDTSKPTSRILKIKVTVWAGVAVPSSQMLRSCRVASLSSEMSTTRIWTRACGLTCATEDAKRPRNLGSLSEDTRLQKGPELGPIQQPNSLPVIAHVDLLLWLGLPPPPAQPLAPDAGQR